MSSYIPAYLEFLSRSKTIDGWPEGIDAEGKAFAIERVQAGLVKYSQLTLAHAQRCIFEGIIDATPVPACLKGVTWDWLYAVTWRALLAAHAEQVWIGPEFPPTPWTQTQRKAVAAAAKRRNRRKSATPK